MEGFIYPNEAVLEWDLLIVIYPYITGLVAGAFIMSSLYHVFGIKSLKPVARFSMLTALAFMLVAPLPLITHLGRPERALEMFLRPNLVSAMSGFGYIWMMYLLLLLVEVWLIFRPNIVNYARISTGVKRNLYTLLAMGVLDITEESLAIDRKLIKVLAAAGIPAACLLHGYVGFIFGAIKANPWWSTPLMPMIFLISAIVSGIALLVVLYILVSKIRRAPLDHSCIHNMALWLGGFLTLALVFEGLEVLSRLYESEEGWDAISLLITQKLSVSYLGIQFGMGVLLPLFIMAVLEFIKARPEVKTVFRFISAAFILIGIFAMRWNVVVGGQMLSKSMRGFVEYSPPLLGESGIAVAAAILLVPLVILTIMLHLLPPWKEEANMTEQNALRYLRATLIR